MVGWEKPIEIPESCMTFTELVKQILLTQMVVNVTDPNLLSIKQEFESFGVCKFISSVVIGLNMTVNDI
jgi:hypothetical protein